MLVYGKNVALEYLNESKKINKVFIQNNFNEQDILKKINNKSINYKVLSKYEMDNKVKGLHQGIILDVPDYKYATLEDIIDGENLIVMLDHLEDPHNFGAIIRTCECAGVNYIIIPRNRSVSVNSTVYKTASGALSHMKIVEVVNLSNTINKLKDMGYWVYAADMDGKDYREIDYSGKTALIIGSEGRGIKHNLIENSDMVVSLPMKGKINSLNASVAAGILIYEIMKYK